MSASAKIDEAVLKDFLLNDSTLWTALTAAGQKAVDYWKTLAPEDPEDREHPIRAGSKYISHPGDYEGAIRFVVVHTAAERYVRVQDHDAKASWIEYGSKHNAAKAPCAQTRAYMLSQGFHAV